MSVLQAAAKRAVIVTGAGRGIGAATARALAADGWPVVVNDVAEDAAETVAADIRAANGVAAAVVADVAEEADILRLFDESARQLGPLGGLVNNAGITGGFRRLQDLDGDTLSRVLRINVWSAMLCAREAVLRLSQRHGGAGGVIVNLSSIAATLGGGGEWIHYAVTKGAINSLTIGLARETAREGVRVNAVAPGLIDTPLHAAAGDPGRVERLAEGIPMGRPGTAEEVAAGVVWLFSPAAAYVTGAVLPIGGGR
jgi:NAD(P)-dependent dehydrogenase (short-subunit alcohol dehydrogenase family)